MRYLARELVVGLERPRAVLVWRRRLGVIAVVVALALALLIGPIWCSTLVSVVWTEARMRYRIVQIVSLSYFVALVASPIGFVSAIAVGIWARRRKRNRLAAWAGRASLPCLGLLIGLGLCEIASAWRLRSLAQVAHPLDLVGVANEPAAERPIKDIPRSTAAADPSREPIRIVMIGGSSAKGFPFVPKMSLDRVIAWQIGREFPGRAVITENRAELGLTLEQAIDRLSGLKSRPDLLIIYSGHNEFQSRFGWMRTTPHYLVESNGGSHTLAQQARKWTSTADLLGRTLDRYEASLAPIGRTEIAPADSPCCTPAEYAALVADYRRRLDSLLCDCDTAGILVMIILPPSNDGAFDPNRSILPPETTLAERKAFVGKLDKVKHGEVADPAPAIEGYRRLIAEQPGFAETHFRLARLLQAAGSFGEAREEYTRAHDLDAFPIRCPTPFLEVCREVGRRHGSIVIDAPRLLALACPHKIPDDRMFDDAHHPGVNAVVLIAREAVRRLKGRAAFGWPANVPAPTFTMADCLARFQLDQADWRNVCEWSSAYYKFLRAARHDTTWRDSLSARYKRAFELLKRGTPPDETDIPALKIREELTAELPPDECPSTVPEQPKREKGKRNGDVAETEQGRSSF